MPIPECLGARDNIARMEGDERRRDKLLSGEGQRQEQRVLQQTSARASETKPNLGRRVAGCLKFR